MAKKPIISQEDIDTFHQAVEGTKPLAKKKIRLTPASPLSSPVTQPKWQAESVTFDETLDLDPVSGDAFIAYKQTDVSNLTLTHLRKGLYPIEAVLDLHGMTIAKAKTAISHFLQHSLQDKSHVILIIHGKGHEGSWPILKNKLNQWLRHMDFVLAFCSAQSSHGSRGALYVLLKRKNQTAE